MKNFKNWNFFFESACTCHSCKNLLCLSKIDRFKLERILLQKNIQIAHGKNRFVNQSI